MDEDTRQFQPINIGMTSVETGKERFTSNGHTEIPQICGWRNNVTALSQRYNLYFAATEDNIMVYVPIFPFQELGRKPALVIVPSLAKPSAQGYINPHDPHDINQLVVGDLGSEEILLIARDSGNVEAYHTKTIHAVVLKNITPSSVLPTLTSDEAGIKPFFSQWVNESAWGLAIHARARMIAVSANVPHHIDDYDPAANLMVFAFALKDADHPSQEISISEDESDPGDDEEWTIYIPTSTDRLSRKRNYKIMLRGHDGHDQNVPCISFFNTPHDTEGDWLLATDIGGHTKVWEVWQGLCYKTWDFSERYRGPAQPQALRAEIDRGWIVAAIDPMAFTIVDTEEEYCGWKKAPLYHGHTSTESWDVTNIVRSRVPSNSQFHPLIPQESMSSSGDSVQEPVDHLSDSELLPKVHTLRIVESDSDDSMEDHEIYEPVVEELSVAPMLITTESTSSLAQDSSLTSVSTDYQESTTFQRNRYDFSMYENENSSEDEGRLDDQFSVGTRSSTSLSSVHHRTTSEEVDEDSQNESSGRQTTAISPTISGHSVKRRRSRVSSLSREMPGSYPRHESAHGSEGSHVPPVPILHCSASHVRLLNDPDCATPHYFCASMLKQTLPDAILYSPRFHLDRLNMFHQIPEIGVIVIASQIGRCAVCSLTRKGRGGPVGFRVDWVLPTKAQEKAKLRSLAPLLGIAVSPVQGRFPVDTTDPKSPFDNDEMIATNRIVDGTPTTFSHSVVQPETDPDSEWRREEPMSSSKNVDEASLLVHKRRRKRRNPRIEQRPWTKPLPNESWRSTENSRRYRLMLTYYDFTVMTYELWRETSDVGIDSSRTNLRNRSYMSQGYGKIVIEET